MDKCDLLRCVDSGLDAFGINLKDATYSALRTNDDLSPCEVLEFPEALVRALKDVFGQAHVFAERSIILEMQKKFTLVSPASSYSMSEAFRIAKREIRKSSQPA